MDAALELEFVPQGERTTFRCTRQDPPWKVVRGFTLPSGECLVHLNNVSGGIFGGDRLQLRVSVGPNASALITSTGATRVYRPRPGTADATLCAQLAVGRDATLEYLPDALIPFRQARVVQRSSYGIAEGGTLYCWDTLAPGRTAAGEIFAYERVKIVSEIKVSGRPVLTDRMLLEPARWPMQSPARFGAYRYLVTFAAVRAGLSAPELGLLGDCLQEVVSGLEFCAPDANSSWGVTSLPAHGVLVRGMIASPVRIPGMLQTLWSAAKFQLCRRVAVAPRKTY
jgi:urease accessory protein